MGNDVMNGVLLTAALTLAASGAPQAQDRPSELQKRRDQIQLMEGVLARAVGLGAAEVSRVLQALDPGSTVLTGQARARGFVLESYGVFFDVEIPALQQSVVWSMMNMQRDLHVGTALDSMRRILESLPEGPTRQQAQKVLQLLRQQVGPVHPSEQNSPAQQVRSEVEAATVGASVPAPVIDDPNTLYTEAVKRQLIDAMLDYSLPIDLRPDEWLTVAARDSDGPMAPGQIYDPMTIILRVSGSDLSIYAADRSRRDEIRSRVQVTVF